MRCAVSVLVKLQANLVLTCQLKFTCFKSTIETLEKGMKYFQTEK